MVKISDCCNNLNSGTDTLLTEVLVGDDSTSTITVSSAGTTLASANTNRRLIKIYVISSEGEIWLRYGSGTVTLANAAHPLLPKHLIIIDSFQARGDIKAITSSGTAQLRVSVANKI